MIVPFLPVQKQPATYNWTELWFYICFATEFPDGKLVWHSEHSSDLIQSFERQNLIPFSNFSNFLVLDVRFS